ncbi:MAG: hypothetical protein ACP5O8_00360 [Candidatus Aenigmatarchaeota archaeon]
MEDYSLDNVIDLLNKMNLLDPFVKELVLKVKKDERFFNEFIGFLKRSGKREIILRIVKKNLLDSCKDLKFSEQL